MNQKHSIVRTLYLYLFSLVGLVMITIGGVRLVDLGLKTYVFPESDIYVAFPERPILPGREGTTAIAEEDFAASMEACSEKCELNEKERAALSAWLDDYRTYEGQKESYPEQNARQNRQRQATSALAFLIVGVPLFGFHWRQIQRDYRAQ